MNKLSKDYNLAALFPEIAKEWHPTKNGELTPDKVFPKSHKKVWWLCNRGHYWNVRVDSRTNHKNNCPYCSGQKVGFGNDLQTKYPKIAKEWHPTKNGKLQPSDIHHCSHKIVWWICKKGHSYDVDVAYKTSEQVGCPYCTNYRIGFGNDLQTKYPK
ncbi:hypothetical protein EB151_08650, partial [archaeon]|nr:hypothetical protein [archaeon]